MEKEYYGIRKGFVKKDDALNFSVLIKAFYQIYRKFYKEGYFQKYFGIDCIDGYQEGQLGGGIATAIFIKTGMEELWPLQEFYSYYSELKFFTMVEFLHDHCSKPTDSFYHDWGECGIHTKSSDDVAGKKGFREAINPFLKRYKNIELSTDGEILENIEVGFESIFSAPIPTENEEIKIRVNNAIKKLERRLHYWEKEKMLWLI